MALRVLILAATFSCSVAAQAEPPAPPEPPRAAPAPDPEVTVAPWIVGLDDAAYLGVVVEEETEHSEGGARITVVVADSPAAAGGLAEGDIIVRFGGEIVRGPSALTKRLRAHEAGDTVAIQVVREGRERKLEVTLSSRLEQIGGVVVPDTPEAPEPLEHYWDAERWAEEQRELAQRMQELGERLSERTPAPRALLQPQAPQFYWKMERPRLGVQLVEVTPELREYLGADGDAGVLVSKVLPGTPAQRAGLAVGDLILSVDGQTVQSSDELVEALADKAGRSFRIEIVRGRESVTLEVTIPDPDAERPTGPRA